jgi:carbon monoxide dehydrogenase subunit G
MLDLHAVITKQADVAATPARALEVLRDVQLSAKHMPDVESVVRIGDEEVFEWTMQKLGAGQVSLQVKYRARYTVENDGTVVRWVPIEGIGNAWAKGTWKLTPTTVKGAPGTHLEFTSEFGTKLPLPWLLKGLADSVLHREYDRLLTAYVKHLCTTIEGGDGRVSA